MMPTQTRGTAPKGPRPVRPITAEYLDRAALHYLERFASSSGNLRRVLMRRVLRAARALGSDPAEGAALIGALIERYLRSGLLNDRQYAEQKAASLARSGSSRYRIRGKLAQKGVEREMIDETVTTLDEEGEVTELAAACALIRRRRLGPYRPAEKRAEFRDKDLASMARAGFGFDLSRRLLAQPDPQSLDRLACGEDEG